MDKSLTPSGSEDYWVTGTDDNGCTGESDVYVQVDEVPSVWANASSTSICYGQSVTLTGSGDADYYEWDNNVTDGQSFTPTSTH